MRRCARRFAKVVDECFYSFFINFQFATNKNESAGAGKKKSKSLYHNEESINGKSTVNWQGNKSDLLHISENKKKQTNRAREREREQRYTTACNI